MPTRKQNEPEIGKMLRLQGVEWQKFTDRQYCHVCHNLIWKTDNLPFDGQGTYLGRAIPIEIKQAETSFPFSDIRENQRAGLTAWEKNNDAPAWLAITMGTDRPNSNSNIKRRSWLVPWSSWVLQENLIREHGLKSMPYSAETTTRKILKKYSADSLLGEYEVKWIPTHGWSIPRSHGFAAYYKLKEFHDGR
jgi:hypothetical protein